MCNRIFIITIIVFLVVILGSCKKSEPTEPVTPASYISFLDYGAVVPSPVLTLITVDPEEIKSASSKNGVLLSSWSAKIQSAEYNHFISIIDNNKLIGAPDPIGGRPCVGSGGMSIFITENNIVDTINISGIYMCDKSCWHTGLDSLVAFQDSLVNKYKR
jgi:hypothetical protein